MEVYRSRVQSLCSNASAVGPQGLHPTASVTAEDEHAPPHGGVPIPSAESLLNASAVGPQGLHPMASVTAEDEHAPPHGGVPIPSAESLLYASAVGIEGLHPTASVTAEDEHAPPHGGVPIPSAESLLNAFAVGPQGLHPTASVTAEVEHAPPHGGVPIRNAKPLLHESAVDPGGLHPTAPGEPENNHAPPHGRELIRNAESLLSASTVGPDEVHLTASVKPEDEHAPPHGGVPIRNAEALQGLHPTASVKPEDEHAPPHGGVPVPFPGAESFPSASAERPQGLQLTESVKPEDEHAPHHAGVPIRNAEALQGLHPTASVKPEDEHAPPHGGVPIPGAESFPNTSAVGPQGLHHAASVKPKDEHAPPEGGVPISSAESLLNASAVGPHGLHLAESVKPEDEHAPPHGGVPFRNAEALLIATTLGQGLHLTASVKPEDEHAPPDGGVSIRSAETLLSTPTAGPQGLHPTASVKSQDEHAPPYGGVPTGNAEPLLNASAVGPQASGVNEGDRAPSEVAVPTTSPYSDEYPASVRVARDNKDDPINGMHGHEGPPTKRMKGSQAHWVALSEETWGFALFPEVARPFERVDPSDPDFGALALTSLQHCPDMKEAISKWMMHAVIITGVDRLWPTTRVATIVDCDNQWIKVGPVKSSSTVLEILRSVLPHATTSDFAQVTVDGAKVTAMSIPPGVDRIQVQFIPVYYKASISMDTGEEISMPVCVTTTVNDVLAQLQTLRVVHMSCVQVIQNENIIGSTDYVMNGSSLKFEVLRKAEVFLPAKLPEVALPVGLLEPPAHADIARSCNHPCIRLAMRDPKWSTVRTIAVTRDTTIAMALSKLMPEEFRDSCVQIAEPRGILLGSMPVYVLLGLTNVEVQLQRKHDIPVATLLAFPATAFEDQFQLGVGQEIPDEFKIKRWIRSPFQVKAYEKNMQSSSTLMEVAARFFAHCRSNQTLMVLINGRIIDPRLRVAETASSDVITVRSCPLAGGTKNQDVKNKINHQLKSRGVKDSELKARSEMFIAKATPEALRAFIPEPYKQQWSSIKSLANSLQVRLVTSEELKKFQQDKKDAKKSETASTASTSKSDSNASLRKLIDMQDITVDMSFLHAEGQEVHPLPASAFGADKTGVAVMHMSQASAYCPEAKLSPEPLAIVAIGSKPIEGKEIQMFPARNGKGDPILIPGCLFNFGEPAISTKDSVANVELEVQDAIVIEFWIQRAECKLWTDVKTPLLYLGQTIKDLKNTQIIASWAIKFYTGPRAVATHADAKYAHGFIRVLAEHVDQVLVKSGRDGVYLVPKGDDRRPHQAFTIIQVPNKSLEELLAMAQRTPNVLGLVDTNSGLMLRCRREHYNKVRGAVFPESPLPEQGNYEPGDELWTLRHLAAHTTASSLTQALKSLGWTSAKALKPVGPNAWSIAARGSPPAMHVKLNGSFVVITPVSKTKTGVSAQALPVPLSAQLSGAGGTPVVNQSPPSRFNELKSELKTHIESLIEDKLTETRSNLQNLNAKVETTCSNVAALQKAQSETDGKIGSLEKTVHEGHQSVVGSMSQMFQKLEASMNDRFNKMESHESKEPKRQKVNE